MRLLTALLLLAAALQTAAQTCGRVHPERRDDLAWENDLVAFRVYGPATERAGERSFGYDLFLKYPGRGPVLERLYAAQTSPANWATVDSLRRIDPGQAKAFENSFTYHIDHGLGMDCFAVGPTLGCGVAAIALADSICYPWCYRSVSILENGPDRFRAELTFAPRTIGADTCVVERRVITLDRGSHLNSCEVSFSGLTDPVSIVVGFPLRQPEPAYADPARGVLAAVDPTQGPDNGKIFLGVVCHTPCEAVGEIDGHRVLSATLRPGETFRYDWGYAWDRTDIPTFTNWTDYLNTQSKKYHE